MNDILSIRESVKIAAWMLKLLMLNKIMLYINNYEWFMF